MMIYFFNVGFILHFSSHCINFAIVSLRAEAMNIARTKNLVKILVIYDASIHINIEDGEYQ